MGIRFRCPHCTRPLNVKSEQAGLQGVCPKCREKLCIPNDSSIDANGNELSSLKDKVKPSTSSDSATSPKNPAIDLSDPINQAPNLVWHVRDENQQESGPFVAKKLRIKIDAGKIKPNDFVCREDWVDWKVAADVFPELGKANANIPRAAESVFTDSRYEIPDAVTEHARRNQEKKRAKTIQISLCVTGLLIVAVLCYLLFSLI